MTLPDEPWLLHPRPVHAVAARHRYRRMSAAVDYAQAGELKFGQVGIANLRVRTLDVAQLAAEMRERVQRAPNLFARAAVVLDFGGLSQVPALEEARALVEGLREAGVLPVALAYGTREIEALSQQLGLPLLAKFRAQYERAVRCDRGRGVRRECCASLRPARALRPKPLPAKVAVGQDPVVRGPRTGPTHPGPLRPAGLCREPRPDRAQRGRRRRRGDRRRLASTSTAPCAAARWPAPRATKRPASSAANSTPNSSRSPATTRCWKTSPQELRGKAVQVWLDNGQLKLAALDWRASPIQRRKANLAEIIVVTSGKGGVGKTTTSASIATRARASRQEGRGHRLRRRPAQPRPDHGLRAPRGVRLRQRHPGRGHRSSRR